MDPQFAGTSPAAHISERRISMTNSEWAEGIAQEFKAGKARKAEEDAELQAEQTTRKGFASKLWTQVKGAFRAKAQTFNAAVGEEILRWDAGGASPHFSLKD